jgi:hypothetical protein
MIYKGPGFLAGPMIRLHATPFPPLTSVFPVLFGIPVCRRSSLLSGEVRGGGERGTIRTKRLRESLALQKSFNTLCLL